MAIGNEVFVQGTRYGTNFRDFSITPAAAESHIVGIASDEGDVAITWEIDPTGTPIDPDEVAIDDVYLDECDRTVSVAIWRGRAASATTVRATGDAEVKGSVFAFTGAADSPEASYTDQVDGAGSATPIVGGGGSLSVVSAGALVVGYTLTPANLSVIGVDPSADMSMLAEETPTGGGTSSHRSAWNDPDNQDADTNVSIEFEWNTGWNSKGMLALSFAPAGSGILLPHWHRRPNTHILR